MMDSLSINPHLQDALIMLFYYKVQKLLISVRGFLSFRRTGPCITVIQDMLQTLKPNTHPVLTLNLPNQKTVLNSVEKPIDKLDAAFAKL